MQTLFSHNVYWWSNWWSFLTKASFLGYKLMRDKKITFFPCRVAEYVTPNSYFRSLGQSLRQNMLLWFILSCRHFKSSRCRERLSPNSPFLPKDRSFQRNLTCRKIPSLRVSLTEENCYHSATPHPDKLYLNFHSSHLFFKGAFIFLKNHLLCPRRLACLFHLRWAFNLEF